MGDVCGDCWQTEKWSSQTRGHVTGRGKDAMSRPTSDAFIEGKHLHQTSSDITHPTKMPKRTRKESEEIQVDEAPTSINPYEVLSLSDDATHDEIKKAYHRAALKHHPDKVAPSEKEAAHTKFQEIAFAFAILSDFRRRARYDATGQTSESLSISDDDDFSWTEFFRAQFSEVVTEEKISQFSEEYKNSDEEKQAVLEAYTKYKGDMSKLYEVVMLSDMIEDEERFREIIDQGIVDGEVERYKKYAQESESARLKRMDKARKQKEREEREARRAEEEQQQPERKKRGKKSHEDAAGSLGDLAAMIQKRQQGRAEGFFDRLEEKYGGGGGVKSGGDGPSEEAFAANRKKGKGKK